MGDAQPDLRAYAHRLFNADGHQSPMLVAHEGETGHQIHRTRRIALGREGLEPGVNRHKTRPVGADHTGVDKQRRPEWGGVCPLTGEIAGSILVVHEDIGPGLKLGEDTQVQVDQVGPRPRAGDDLRRQVRLGQRCNDGLQIGRPLFHRIPAFGIDGNVLLPPAIVLDPAIGQVSRVGNCTRCSDGGLR